MSLAAKGEGTGKLAPWIAPVLTALMAAGASIIGATYVTGQRTGAQDTIIAEHTQRLDHLEADSKEEGKTTTSAALTLAKELGGLSSQVSDLARGFDRLEQRLDNDGASLKQRAPSP